VCHLRQARQGRQALRDSEIEDRLRQYRLTLIQLWRISSGDDVEIRRLSGQIEACKKHKGPVSEADTKA